jgi:hypothetical protein
LKNLIHNEYDTAPFDILEADHDDIWAYRADVSDETFERWKRVMNEFHTVQCEMTKASRGAPIVLHIRKKTPEEQRADDRVRAILEGKINNTKEQQ